MLAKLSCDSALRSDLLRPPGNLYGGARFLRLQKTRSCRRGRGHGPAAPRIRPSASALPTHHIFQELSNNQVLVAVLTATLIGQMLKPFTAAARGKGFNWKLVISSGGMPSTHSACVTAACTSIALERGFADPLFGLSVVFAGIVMYDAQGVRRAVGKQAEVINTLLVGTCSKRSAMVSAKLNAELQASEELRTLSLSPSQRRSSSLATSSADEEYNDEAIQDTDNLSRKGSFNRPKIFMELAKKMPSVEAGDVSPQEIGDLEGWRNIPLKESVGHTKFEVIIGGLWGIFSTLALSHLSEVAFFQTIHS